jgi:hypothetical protein
MSGAHVNIADEKGRTPLHIAVELGDPVLSDRVLIGGFNVLTCVLPLCLCAPPPFHTRLNRTPARESF